MTVDPIVVAGASLAGVRAAESLRRLGHDGPLVVVGAEDHPPYDRPPLSKRVIDGTADSDDAVREATTLPVDAAADITWRLGTTVTSVDIGRRRLTVDDGEELAWSGLVVATGAHPRVLPGFEDREGVHVLRSLDDGLALRRELDGGPAVVVIGAGFIGLEVAASCRKRGLDVTVLEPQPEPLAHVLGPELGRAIAALHLANGVDLRLGTTVRAPAGDGRVTGVVVDDGEVVPADVVVMGIGVQPTTRWLEGSGIDVARGVLCDERLRVLVGDRPRPDVVAAGDVARWMDPVTGVPVRNEHWTNAVEQGAAAARALLAPEGSEPFATVPYVWSDQYSSKLQMVGRPLASDEVQVVDGTPGEGRWAVAFGRDGRLTGALGASRPARIMKLRKALEGGEARFPVEVAPAG